MDALTLLKTQMANARREWLGATGDVSPEMAHWQPPGVANPIDDLFFHTIAGQDRQIARLSGGTPKLESWAEKLNVPPDWRHAGGVSRNHGGYSHPQGQCR